MYLYKVVGEYAHAQSTTFESLYLHDAAKRVQKNEGCRKMTPVKPFKRKIVTLICRRYQTLSPDVLYCQ